MVLGIVIPEVDDDRIILSAKRAKELLKYDEDGNVHSFGYSPVALMGALVEGKSLDNIFGGAKSIEIAGDNAMDIGHGIAVIDEEDNVIFFEHDPILMEKLIKEYGGNVNDGEKEL